MSDYDQVTLRIKQPIDEDNTYGYELYAAGFRDGAGLRISDWHVTADGSHEENSAGLSLSVAELGLLIESLQSMRAACND